MASQGYPESGPRGLPIEGLEEAEATSDVLVFHSGTAISGGRVVTAGGRVIAVTALGPDLSRARELAYGAVSRIRWEGEQHRTDIAIDALRKLRRVEA
jgi:phosphoribosylamine--glycine ligase